MNNQFSILLKLIGSLFIWSNLNINVKAQTISDIDGNIYNTITIGSQIWMKENLKSHHFSNGDLISTTLLPVNNDSTSIYQWAYNNDSINIKTYGRLYTWYVVNDNRNVCPIGWHVPSLNEWNELSDSLGGELFAGNKMKEIGTTHWSNTDTLVNNASGFTALPSGFRGNSNVFLNINDLSIFWSATPFGISSFQRGNCISLQANNSSLHKSVAVAQCGMSVRCINNSVKNNTNPIFENSLKIYPNPVSNNLIIEVVDFNKLVAKIYNSIGILVLQTNLDLNTNIIDFSPLPQGMYILQITTKNTQMNRKIIKN